MRARPVAGQNDQLARVLRRLLVWRRRAREESLAGAQLAVGRVVCVCARACVQDTTRDSTMHLCIGLLVVVVVVVVVVTVDLFFLPMHDDVARRQCERAEHWRQAAARNRPCSGGESSTRRRSALSSVREARGCCSSSRATVHRE